MAVQWCLILLKIIWYSLANLFCLTGFTKAKVEDPEFEVHETNILVVRNAGPKGYPGMPEVSNLPIPKKILNKGGCLSVRLR